MIRCAFILSFLILTGCTTLMFQAEPPEVLVSDVKPLGSTLFEQRLQVDLRVRNPNNFDLDVTGLDFTLSLNEQRLARGLASQSVIIPRLGEAILTVETTTSTLDIFQQLLQLTSGENIAYQISGVLHVQDMPLPFDSEGILLDTSKITPTFQEGTNLKNDTIEGK